LHRMVRVKAILPVRIPGKFESCCRRQRRWAVSVVQQFLPKVRDRTYCAVRKIGDSPPRTAQSGGESAQGRRPALLGRVSATQAWMRGKGWALAAGPVQGRGPSPRTKQRGGGYSHYSVLRSNGAICPLWGISALSIAGMGHFRYSGLRRGIDVLFHSPTMLLGR